LAVVYFDVSVDVYLMFVYDALRYAAPLAFKVVLVDMIAFHSLRRSSVFVGFKLEILAFLGLLIMFYGTFQNSA